MRSGLREMRVRLPVPLLGPDQILMANRMSVRSETPAGKATTVGLSGSLAERGQIAGPLWSTMASQRLAGQSIAKGRIGREARRG